MHRHPWSTLINTPAFGIDISMVTITWYCWTRFVRTVSYRVNVEPIVLHSRSCWTHRSSTTRARLRWRYITVDAACRDNRTVVPRWREKQRDGLRDRPGRRVRPAAVSSNCSDAMRRHRFVLSVLLLLPAVRAAADARNAQRARPKDGTPPWWLLYRGREKKKTNNFTFSMLCTRR